MNQECKAVFVMCEPVISLCFAFFWFFVLCFHKITYKTTVWSKSVKLYCIHVWAAAAAAFWFKQKFLQCDLNCMITNAKNTQNYIFHFVNVSGVFRFAVYFLLSLSFQHIERMRRIWVKVHKLDRSH